MLTRSKSATISGTVADLPPPPVTTIQSQVSVAKTAASCTSDRARRQRALDIKRKAAVQLADLERRRIENEEKLIQDQIALDIEALDLESCNGDVDICLPSNNRTTRKNNFATASNCDRTKPTDAARDPPSDSNTKIDKFLARQTSAKELPVFTGAPEEWLLFYSQFKITTQLCGYSDDENIARLMRCLRGEARDSVYALLTSASNLDRIIDTLQLRFGRSDIIIESMITKIQAYRDIRHDDLTQLMKYATEVQNIVAVMVSTENVSHLRNPTLIRNILSKLPSNLKYQWGIDKLRRGMYDITLEDVAEWLMEVAKATAEFTTTPSSSRIYDKRSYNRDYRHNDKHVPVMTTNKSNKDCQKCHNNHDLQKCPDFLRLSIDDRWNFVTTKKLCFSCLSPRHQLKACTTKAKCGMQGCERVHHRILHAEPRQAAHDDATLMPASSDDPNDTIIATTQSLTQPSHVLLKVIRIVVSGRNGDIETSALLDEGAAVSLIDASLAARAGIDGPLRPLRICGAHGMTSLDSTSRSVSFNVRGRNNTEIFKLVNVRTVNNLKLPVNNFPVNKNVVDRNFLINYFDKDDLTFDKVDMLIGQDNIDLIVTRQIIQCGPRHGPIISKTKLGYVLHGVVNMKGLSNDTVVLHCECEDLNDLYSKTFRTEDFGVKLSSDTPRSREDMQALDIMKSTTRYLYDLKRWETGLLWRDDSARLPVSFNQAFVRLKGIQRKMAKLPEFAEKYQQKIEDYIKKGYARKLTFDEARNRSDKTWYLPHFAVFNPNKPNKLRFVTDAAAKSDGKSLNDFLLPGPDFLNSLPGMLLQFRCHRYAIMGDIQEMFHQVRIIEQDRQAQRFLWAHDEYQMDVMIFGAVCSPSSAQYVKNANALRFAETHPDAVKAITDHHYMDDLILSVDTLDQGTKIIQDVVSIHADGGFNMTSFMSNSKEILSCLPEKKLSNSGAKVLNDTTDLTVERVLGVKWTPGDDKFVFSNLCDVIDSQADGRPTKRHILKVCMSVFDPLGFLLFVTIKARIILQDIWKTKIGWDDEVTGDLNDRWRSWLQELRVAIGLHIPRWFLSIQTDLSKPVEVHVFCDASTRAFAAVAYLRSTLTDGSYHVSMIMARARVAPLKVLSVPRLELQGSVLGARMAQSIKKYIDLTISRTIYWSDSKTVLSWIRSEAGRFKPFVAHRISEIADLTDPSDWRWVPTHLNHADLATRDKTCDVAHTPWITGPDFLRQEEDAWQMKDSHATEEVVNSDPEVKVAFVITSHSNDSLPNLARFSSYWRLVRATAWILRFRHNLTNRSERRSGELLADEITEAELLLTQDSQQRSFPNETHTLQTTGKVDKNSRLFQLVPFLDAPQGLIRARGRIDSADVEYDTKNPIILSPSDDFTRLIVMQYHKDAAHCGKEKVFNDIQQKFWILRGRSAVKAAWRTCQVCKNNRAMPTPPLMGQLPISRLTPIKVFAYTGLDYFGPMVIKIGRRHEKRYAALFTCMTVRAVHIELVDDLTSDSAIMALRRFIARRGTPNEIWSDNATTFKGADKELRRHVENLDADRLRQFFSVRRIKWKFICPSSPHHGGCWERMVRSIKTALKMTLKEQVTTEQTLQTLLAEAESMVNSRPLTHISLDNKDSTPLTPNHFIFGGQTDFAHQPLAEFNDRDLLRKSWRHSQRLADLLWKRWMKEYLPTLTRRGKWFLTAEPLKAGDVVVVCDDQLPRNQWPKGILDAVYPGADGQVRVADVRTLTGVYKRPVTRLCRLDIRHD